MCSNYKNAVQLYTLNLREIEIPDHITRLALLILYLPFFPKTPFSVSDRVTNHITLGFTDSSSHSVLLSDIRASQSPRDLRASRRPALHDLQSGKCTR